MYLAVEKYNRLKVFTLQNILCFNGNILKLKELGLWALRLQPFFLSVLFLLTLTKSKKGGDLLLWMYVMLDLISFVWASSSCEKREESEKTHNENVRLQLESNQQPIAFQTGALDRLVTLTDDKLCLKVLHYYGIWIKSTLANTFIKCIMVSCIHTKFCKQ